ncbi:MAG TPA: PAS domain-containing sensor histidine kinase [Xylella sp.]
MLNTLDAGFCVVEVLLEDGQPVDGIFRLTNPSFGRHLRLGSVVGKSLREVMFDDELQWIERYGGIALTGRRVHFEVHARVLRRWYSVEVIPVGSPNERLLGVLFMDITERKRMEHRLAESEVRFNILADDLPMPVWILDAQGVMRFVNTAYGEFFGVDLNGGTVPCWDAVLHPEDWMIFEFKLSAALKKQSVFRALVRARRYDGQWRWIEMSATPRYSPDGRFIGLMGSSPDVTERREIELAREQLLKSERAARNEAENMARLKDEFLSTLSHELRTPLTTILGWSELLLQRIDQNHPSYKGLSVIASSAKVQKRLISDMLDLSSMLLGKMQLEMEVLDLVEQLREVVSFHEQMAESKEQTLMLRGPEMPCLVLGDATRLRKVFENLLSNAIKFTPMHGAIDVDIRIDGDCFRVSVTDSGDGIEAEFLPHLFSRFRQADGTTTRSHGGLGLGLAIVQNLVEMHGGHVSATSPGLGKGAIFTVQLSRYICMLNRHDTVTCDGSVE